MKQDSEISDLLEGLTEKQREVLDLLMLHKTSKQIARDLCISPHTVDQRIVAARRKFDVETRGELAAAYMSAQAQSTLAQSTLARSAHEMPKPPQGGDAPIYEKSVYQSSQVENHDHSGEKVGGSDAVMANGDVRASSGKPPNRTKPVAYYRVVPESFEGRNGYFWRFIAIVGITLGLLIATLVGLAIFGELSELLR